MKRPGVRYGKDLDRDARDVPYSAGNRAARRRLNVEVNRTAAKLRGIKGQGHGQGSQDG